MTPHREFVPSHVDPAKLGACAPRSTQEGGARLTLRLRAQSMMQGPVEILNMMGGLTSDSADWSKVRPAGWLEMKVSWITCKNRTFIFMLDGFMHHKWPMSSFYSFIMFKFLHSSYSWWLKTSVNRRVSNTIGFHITNNSTDDLICWRQKHNNLKMYKNAWNMNHQNDLRSYKLPLSCRTALQGFLTLQHK